MSVYTRRFWAAIATERATGPSVPSGKVWVLRCIDVVPGGTGATDFYCGVEGGGYFWATKLQFPEGPIHAQWTGRQVVEAGEALLMFASQPASFYMTGYELDAGATRVIAIPTETPTSREAC